MNFIVEVTRGDLVESTHSVHVAAWHAERGLIASTGNPAHVTFVRSAIKMFQALPLVETGGMERFGFTEEELALCTASHGGEPFHVSAARSMLEKAKLTEQALACGAQMPMHAPSADALRDAGLPPTRLHNNCSGKHAGMLAFTIQQGWVTKGYHTRAHPTQQRIITTFAEWAEVDPSTLVLAVDGCGLPTLALPVESVARACARFAAAAADGDPAPARIFQAMTGHPEYVAGTDRLCTDLMSTASGRLFAKVGAEGYYCAGVPSMRLGVAVKVEDGAWRAVEPALLAMLHRLDAITTKEFGALAHYSMPDITNTRGETVGRIRARWGA